MSQLVPLPPWQPDVTDLGTETSQSILNCVPRSDGYGPFPSLVSFTQALPGPCRGYFYARKSDGSIAVFAGTSTELYLLNNTDFTWIKVSQATYSTLVSTDMWQFAQFNDLVIAVQVNTVPQKFALSSSTAFSDLGGTPPSAGGIAIVGFFVVLTNLLANPRRVQWSDLSAPETWSAGVGLSDFEDLPDGGSTIGVSGGDAYGLVFQESSIRSLIYAPGSPAIFQINRLSTQESLFGKYSLINVGNMTFYCGAAGFKMIVAAGDPIPIGKEKVDQTFFADVDRSNLQLIIGASDPTSTRIYFAYKSQQGNTALFDTLLCYDWALKRWTPLDVSGEYLASLAKPGLTLEQLDAIAPGALQVTGAANNGSGLIRLTLNAISNAFFAIAGQNFIVVQGVLGTTEANGTWKVNIIDSTHIDLVGSTFVHAYVSGGAIGGSLDALTFSLDSISKSSTAQLSAFGAAHTLGFFSGPSLEAITETAEVDGSGQMVFTTQMIPLTDSPAVFGSIGVRNNANAAIAYTSESAIDDMGQISINPTESRYQRMKLRFPAGAVWSYVRAIHPDTTIGGDR
jgi:hypothetical protein